MKRASFILVCLIASLTQAQTTRTVTSVSDTPSKFELKTGKDKVQRTYLIGENKPFTGHVVHIDSWNHKDYEYDMVDGLKHGQYLRWTTSRNPNFVDRKITYVQGKKSGEDLEYEAPGVLLR